MNTETDQQDAEHISEETISKTLSLPQFYPLSTSSKQKLKQIQPQSKTTYNDRFIQPYLDEIKDSIMESISIQLEIAAQKFQAGLIDENTYNETKNIIYKDASSTDYTEGIRDAFNQYSLSSDAYSLFLTAIFKKNSQTLDISNLYDYVSNEKELLKNNPNSQKTLIEDFQFNFDNLSSQNNSPLKKEIAKVSNNLQQFIFISVYPENPLPSKLTNDGNVDDDDDDLEVEGGKVNLTCPISREIFVRPVKNTNCPHTYGLDALKIYLRSSRECPECGVAVSLSDVRADKIMEVRVKCYNRDKKLNELIKDRFVDETDKL